MKIRHFQRSNSTFHLQNKKWFHTNLGIAPVLALELTLVFLRSDSIRNYLFQLGYEKVRFYAYQKLSPLTVQNGGGFIKTVVSDLSLFVRREWAKEQELFRRVCKITPIPEIPNTLNSRRFFMSLGGMLLTGKEGEVLLLTDELLGLYMKNVKQNICLESPINQNQRAILKVASKYYQSCKINYRMLYDPKIGPKSFDIGDLTFSIELPTLPQISSKQLLSRALLHKELYRALLLPNHSVYQQLECSKTNLSSSASKVIRYDLLFLDGLGDLLIASESCQFLYNFRMLHPYSNDSTFGKKTFTLLRNTLGTNTLLLRLATLYNMHLALEDPMVSEMLRKSYVPHTFSNFEADPQKCSYEEEFLADYFEQYIGALFLDLPEVATQWLTTLFERILSLISDAYKISYRRTNNFRFDYRAWSMDVIGRPLLL